MKVWIWWLILVSIMFNFNLLKWNSSKTYFFRDSFLNFTMSKNQIRCTDNPWNPHWRRSSRIFSIIIWQIILEFFLCFFSLIEFWKKFDFGNDFSKSEEDWHHSTWHVFRLDWVWRYFGFRCSKFIQNTSTFGDKYWKSIRTTENILEESSC